MSLLHLMVDQISSILYQAEVVKDIVDVKQYYQTIIDHISAVIIVVDYEFNILFKNKKYDEYFNFECKTLDQLIQRYPSLDVTKKIMDYSDTELTLNIDAHQFKLSIQLLSANEIVFLLTDVTEIVKMQDDLVKSSKLKGMGTFVAGIAHEIKNPLVAVKTFTQLLSKDWDNADLRKKCIDVVLPQLYKINHLSVIKKYGRFKKNNI